jgi:hypothetical protein
MNEFITPPYWLLVLHVIHTHPSLPHPVSPAPWSSIGHVLYLMNDINDRPRNLMIAR